MKYKAIALLTAVLMTIPAAGCSSRSKTTPDDDIVVIGGKPTTETIETVTPTEAETEPPTEAEERLHFAAVGDNLIHKAVYRTAENHAENGKDYDFHYCYQAVEDTIKKADLAFINQETVICNGEFEISGSNLNFNSPNELGDDLIDVGFDIVSMANNHVLDKGSSGMRACLDYWDSQTAKNPGLLVLGAYRDYQDMYDYRITEVNGIRVGMLA